MEIRWDDGEGEEEGDWGIGEFFFLFFLFCEGLRWVNRF